MVTLHDVTLAILAGGEGTRLGRVRKASVRVGGRTLLDRVLDLSSLCAGTMLVVREGASWPEAAVRVVADRVPGKGAPGGLHAALSSSATPWVLLVASDMPFIHAAFVTTLARYRRPGGQWVCVEHDGHLQPMPGLYHRELLAPLTALLTTDPSFRDLLSKAPGERVPAAAFADADPELKSVQSLNTPEDLLRFGGVLPDGTIK